MPRRREPKSPPEERERRSELREYLEAILIAVVFLQFATTFVVKTFYIPSGSMEDTLLVGDHLFVNRFVYGPAATDLETKLLPRRPVERGDIVIFRSPEDPELDVVKRCIGLPGDVLRIERKQLYVNGEPVDDDAYTEHRDPRVFPPSRRIGNLERLRDNMPEVTVPEDHYLCFGDNRDYSYDSRYWGPLPAHMVKGRASVIYWSYGGEVGDGRWRGAGERIGRFVRTLGGFFTDSRWDRTFHLPR